MCVVCYTGSMTTPSFFHSIAAKALGVGILALILLIPTFFVANIVSEREQRLREVQAEISQSFGRPQVIAGPVLAIPYRYFSVTEDTKIRQEQWSTAYFLPTTLKVDGRLTPETRSRGIFDAVVYKATLGMSGAFRPDPKLLSLATQDFKWNEAKVVVDITDGRGITKNVSLTANGKEHLFSPGAATFGLTSVSAAGVGNFGSSATWRDDTKYDNNRNFAALAGAIPEYAGGDLTFAFSFDFNGSEQLDIAPLGEETAISLAGNWDKPSFVGDLLPINKTIDNGVFTASWQVSQYGRGVPQAFRADAVPQPNMTALRLLSPVDFYAKTDRTVKYALLFIGLTFTAFFLVEVLKGLRVHPLQYLLVGFALALFFLLLLALSEHIGFDAAYLVAASAIVLLITAYTASVLSTVRSASMIGGLLAALYAYLYILLLLEEKSLLVGAVGLFCVLALMMRLTAKVDWYAVGIKSGQ